MLPVTVSLLFLKDFCMAGSKIKSGLFKSFRNSSETVAGSIYQKWQTNKSHRKSNSGWMIYKVKTKQRSRLPKKTIAGDKSEQSDTRSSMGKYDWKINDSLNNIL